MHAHVAVDRRIAWAALVAGQSDTVGVEGGCEAGKAALLRVAGRAHRARRSTVKRAARRGVWHVFPILRVARGRAAVGDGHAGTIDTEDPVATSAYHGPEFRADIPVDSRIAGASLRAFATHGRSVHRGAVTGLVRARAGRG